MTTSPALPMIGLPGLRPKASLATFVVPSCLRFSIPMILVTVTPTVKAILFGYRFSSNSTVDDSTFPQPLTYLSPFHVSPYNLFLCNPKSTSLWTQAWSMHQMASLPVFCRCMPLKLRTSMLICSLLSKSQHFSRKKR